MSVSTLEIKVTSAAPGMVATARMVNNTFNTIWCTFPYTSPSTLSIEPSNQFQLYATQATGASALTASASRKIVAPGNAYKVSSSLEITGDGRSANSDVITVTNLSGHPINLVLQCPISLTSSANSDMKNVWMTETMITKNQKFNITPSDAIAVWVAPPHTSEDGIIPGCLTNVKMVKYTDSLQKLEFRGNNTSGYYSEPNGLWI
ncbi:hypothetical protein CPB86DRAFT_792015 [Serendipita vermifera]|nr:hypothetical protein CPB86DRAFT_792015 [Serendipita vermifera]